MDARRPEKLGGIAMISAILGLLTGIVGWLVSHLPESPFTNLAFGDIGGLTLGTMLGWVNWLIPMQDMLALFMLWLVACVAFVAARWLINKFTGNVTVEKLPLT